MQARSISHPESSAYPRIDMGWSHSTCRDPPAHWLLQHWGPHRKKATTLDRACNPHVWESFATKALLWRAVLWLSLPRRAKKAVQGSFAFHSETVFYSCIRSRVSGCLSFNLAFHLSRSCSLFCPSNFEARRTEAGELQRQSRHLRQAGVPPPPGTGVICPVCNRRCTSNFGLRSHIRTYSDSDEE